MAEDGNKIQEQIDLLKKQIELFQQQLLLYTAQQSLDTAKQTQEAQAAKAVADALKNQVTAQYDLEAAKAKLPLAELAGVKAALANMQLPAGKSGTVQVAAGTSGAALLRSKKPMLKLLDDVAEGIKKELKNDTVIVTEEVLDQAYKACYIGEQIDIQEKNLASAINAATPAESRFSMAFLPQFAAGAYSLGFVLDTVNSLSKIFRADSKIDVFSADAEALQLLGYILEGKSTEGLSIIADPVVSQQEVTEKAKHLLGKLNKLFKDIQRGTDLLSKIKKLEEDEAASKTKQGDSKMPEAEKISNLRAQIDLTKALLDGLDPNKKPDAFWAQLKGAMILDRIRDRDMLMLQVKAQSLQISKSRFLMSDRIYACGEVQAAYRIIGKNGKVSKTGVILKTSEIERIDLNQKSELKMKD